MERVYLTGSYARGTVIRPFDDVDMVFEIDPETWHRSFFSRLFSAFPSPEAVLRTFVGSMRRLYPTSSLRMQRRSVRLRLSKLNIDLVPGVRQSGNDGVIRIPDLVERDWIVSAPRVHTEFANELDSEQKGRFRPVVRLAKAWNRGLPARTRTKSFAIETIAARLFSEVPIESLHQGLFAFFDFLSHFCGAALFRWDSGLGISLGSWKCEVPDLAGTGSNTVSGMNGERRARLLERAVRVRDRLLRADKARSSESAWGYINSSFRGGLPPSSL